MGIIKDISTSVLNELLIMTQPAHIQKVLGITLEPNTRDAKRAELIRVKLNNHKGEENV